MDSTEANPDVATNGPDPSATAPPHDDVDAAPAGRGAEAALAAPSGEATQETPVSDGRPRPRRRRRRRRRPIPAAASGETLAAGDAQPDAPPDAPPTATAEAAPGGEVQAEGESPRPILRLPHRRRRRRPRALGLLPGPAESTADAGAAVASELAGAVPTPATPSGQRSFRAPRRRRRHAPLSAAPAPQSSAETAAGDRSRPPGAPAAPAGEPGARPRRPRNRRRGIPPGSPAAEGGQRRQRSDGSPGAAATPRGRDGRGPDERQRAGGERRDRGPRDRRAGPPGRGRGPASPRPVERKLYSLDSVVDRGFDDIEEEAGTRRVHWTILKRTTADQISRKALAAVYVLQRDGADSEFPNLGAARAAVNKTIVHPEKLTRSKAEYAAEKAGKK